MPHIYDGFQPGNENPNTLNPVGMSNFNDGFQPGDKNAKPKGKSPMGTTGGLEIACNYYMNFLLSPAIPNGLGLEDLSCPPG
ncbi:MAG: hypothetical protein PHO32_05410 [Candidatus Cloacimonetes bacterium]|nr:hypothetical protein [Candidatus Cloacimonadota bacterium]